MIRLRYKKVNDLLTLHRPVLAGADLLQVTIVTNTLEAVITSINRALPIKTLKAESLTDLKKAVKQELKDFGANFTAEVRPGRALNDMDEAKADYDNQQALDHHETLTELKEV